MVTRLRSSRAGSLQGRRITVNSPRGPGPGPDRLHCLARAPGHGLSGQRARTKVRGMKLAGSHAHSLPGRWRSRPKRRRWSRGARLTRACGLPAAVPERNANRKHLFWGSRSPREQGEPVRILSFLTKNRQWTNISRYLDFARQPRKGLSNRQHDACVLSVPSALCVSGYVGSWRVSASLGIKKWLVL